MREKKTFLIFSTIFRIIFYVVSAMFVYVRLWLSRVQHGLRHIVWLGLHRKSL